MKEQQRGFALLVVLLAATIGTAALFVSAGKPGARERAERGVQASAALARASEALRAYAFADGYRDPGNPPAPTNVRPGSLPCPDADDPPDYAADLFSGNDCPEYVGRLPHRTLDIPLIRGSEKEPLWYALDPAFRDHDDAEPINPGTPGTLTIDGSGAYVAVILAPGAGAALEASNTDGDGDFTDCRDDPTCNDRARGITVEQLLALVPQRVLAEVKTALEEFHDDEGHYPWAALLGDPDGECDSVTERGTLPISDGNCGSYTFRKSSGGPMPDWIIDNGWYRYVYYAVAQSCVVGGCGTGLLTLDGTSGRAVVIATTGVPIVSAAKGSMQNRTGAVPQDVIEHLDSPENTDEDDVFDDPDNGDGENDRLRALAPP